MSTLSALGLGKTKESIRVGLCVCVDEASRTPTINIEDKQGQGPRANLQYAKRPQGHGLEQRTFGDRIP